ncbi:hypothetical protein HMPREF0063_11439 [Aeromicrobium marinum DSM 15272]|uniref:Uncharacterized protein n=1 Tax=Aeromicrobium marinum DSM 15272 TaxID=585531 RepID=E2SBN0_9ACTN|nr:hypothetical protein [Aeromicrobium marinum]EFQ83776.1 hypothetical protein HMPREF0063_11439 [Aeromicrobium marinum DSM 15272]
MPLRHRPDVDRADWFVRSEAVWETLATLGPPGLEAYARVPTVLGLSDTEVMADVLAVLARHTGTPDQAWFGLWDGWGDLYGGRQLEQSFDFSSDLGRIFSPPRPQDRPAFAPDVLDGPRVDVGHRSYLLFSGPLSAAGDWGARPVAPGWPRRSISVPNLAWPEDRAWFVASDVDADWIGVGGPASAVDAVLAVHRLQARRATYGPHPSGWGPS